MAPQTTLGIGALIIGAVIGAFEVSTIWTRGSYTIVSSVGGATGMTEVNIKTGALRFCKLKKLSSSSPQYKQGAAASNYYYRCGEWTEGS